MARDDKRIRVGTRTMRGRWLVAEALVADHRLRKLTHQCDKRPSFGRNPPHSDLTEFQLLRGFALWRHASHERTAICPHLYPGDPVTPTYGPTRPGRRK